MELKEMKRRLSSLKDLFDAALAGVIALEHNHHTDTMKLWKELHEISDELFSLQIDIKEYEKHDATKH